MKSDSAGFGTSTQNGLEDGVPPRDLHTIRFERVAAEVGRMVPELGVDEDDVPYLLDCGDRKRQGGPSARQNHRYVALCNRVYAEDSPNLGHEMVQV